MHKLNFLGIQQEHGSIAKSAVYALFADSEDAGVELALTSLEEGSRNFLLSLDPIHFTSKSRCMAFDKLHAFTIDKLYYEQNSYKFVSQVFEELNYHGGLRNSHIVIHLPEELLVDIESEFVKHFLKRCKALSELYEISLVLLLTGKIAHQKVTLFFEQSTFLRGLGRMTSKNMTHKLYFDFWHHPNGVASNITYTAFFDDRPYVQLEEQVYEDEPEFQPNLDQVFIAKELLPSDTKLPPNYMVCNDNESVVNAARANNLATVVLCAARGIDKVKLAGQCYKLRKSRGAWLKIIVKNKDGVLRHHDECVFLTLGVNLILHTTTDVSRLMSQVQAVQGVKFVRSLPKDYKRVLAHANGVSAKGYLRPLEFIDAVKLQREASLSTGISGVLVILDLIKGVEPIDALRLFSVKRNGDIFTANQSQVLLYLHACRENDVTNALERLFRLTISEFFISHIIYSEDLFIEQQCRDLMLAHENSELEDYSKLLQESNINNFPSVLKTSEYAAVTIDNDRPASRKQCEAFPLKLLEND
ncbi:cellulose biosynthesis protein BcsE [Pseudoalteromonas spongiae]|uniref:cellulose biosynthesis protein BcsE n=1 Tax=Pseudoalteromonas spongiae TaxID=298657 RepID=UPI000C2D4746|nr:cellulose biosynthesis protein BcsE [Pseudoalteromonas spongiae]